jgi:hypothetical protein
LPGKKARRRDDLQPEGEYNMPNRLILIAGLLTICSFTGLFVYSDMVNAQDDNTQNNDKKILTTPCNKLLQFGLSVSCGTNTITVGFHRKKGESQADFEKRLQTDFDGEITIGDANSEVISMIKYHDFSGFAESPSGETYGPVYTFNINDCSGKRKRDYIRVSPKIRSKEENAYTLSIMPQNEPPQNKSFWAGLFSKNTDTENKTNKINKTFQTFAATDPGAIKIPAPVERIDMLIDRPDRYGFSVVFPFNDPKLSNGDVYVLSLGKYYTGNIKILHNNTLLYDMYNMPIENTLGATSGPRNINGVRYYYMGWGNSFDIKEPGVYSFILVIFSSEESEFKKLSFDNSVFTLEVERFTGFVK